METLDPRLGTPCRFCGSWALLCRWRYMRVEKIEVAGRVNLVHCCAKCQNQGAAEAHQKIPNSVSESSQVA